VEAKIVKSAASSGLALIGDNSNMVRMMVMNDKITISKLINAEEEVLMEKSIKTSGKLTLRLGVEDGQKVSFSYSVDGKSFNELEPSGIDAKELPPWDRALRVGLVASGKSNSYAIFDSFVLRNLAIAR